MRRWRSAWPRKRLRRSNAAFPTNGNSTPSKTLPDTSQPTPPNAPTAARKADHIRINAERDVGAKGVGNGFERYIFAHQALPEIDLAEVDTSTRLFGRRLAAPLLISCMTGGTPEGARINRILATVAAEHGLAMGLGSGRAALESPETLETFDVRSLAPDVPLLANLGAVQLNKGTVPAIAAGWSSACVPMRSCCTLTRCKRRFRPKATRVFAVCSKESRRFARPSTFPSL